MAFLGTSWTKSYNWVASFWSSANHPSATTAAPSSSSTALVVSSTSSPVTLNVTTTAFASLEKAQKRKKNAARLQNRVLQSGPAKGLQGFVGMGRTMYGTYQLVATAATGGTGGMLAQQAQQLIQGRPTPENVSQLDSLLTQYRAPQAAPLRPEQIVEILQILQSLDPALLKPLVAQDKFPALAAQIENFEEALALESADGASINLPSHATLNKSAENLHEALKSAINPGVVDQVAQAVNNALNKKPHDDLDATRNAMNQLRLAIKNLPEDKLVPNILKLIKPLAELIAHPKQVFSQSFMPTQVQLETLRQFYNTLIVATDRKQKTSIYEISQSLSDAFSIIEPHYIAQRGIVSSVKDNIFEMIADVTASITGGPSAAPSGDYFSVGGILEGALNVLKTGFAKAQQASTSTFSSYLLYMILEIKKRIQNDPNSGKVLTALDQLIPEIEKAVQSGAVGQLKEVMTACIEIVNQNPVYVNGRLVWGSAEDLSQEGIQKLMDNIKITESRPAVVTREPQNYAHTLEIEKQKLVKNASQFGAISFVFEQGLLGLGQIPLKKEEYLRLIDGKDEETIQKDFFAKIDATQCNWLRKGWIKYIVFPFVKWIARIAVNETAGQFLRVINSLIQSNATNEFKDVGNHAVTNFTRYLETLGSAYERVSKEPVVGRTLTESLDKELGRKECNLVAGQELTPKELYDKASETAAKHFTPRISWSGSIYGRWKEWNILGKLIGWPLFILGEPCILVGQLIVNRLLQFGYSTAMVKTQTLNNIVTNSVNAFGDNINGPKHAILSVLYDRLEIVLDLLNKEYAKGNEPPNNNNGTSNGLEDKLSPFNTTQIARLVKNLLEVVEKNKKLTRSELRQSIENPSASERAQKAVEDVFLPKVVETATTLIAVAFQSVLNRNEVEAQMCNLMQVINNGFVPGTPISEGEVRAKEQGIKKISDSILDISIRMAIDKNADFSNNKQQKQSDDFVHDMQNQTQLFIRDIREKVGQARTEFQPGRSHNVIAQIDQAVRAFTQFNETRIHKTFESNNNPDFNDDTRRRFDKMTKELAEQIAPIGKGLKEVQQLQHPRISNQQTIEALKKIRTGIGEIFKVTKDNFRCQEIHECKLKLETLSITLSQIQIEPGQQSFVDILKEFVRKTRLSLDILQNQRAVSDVTNDLRPPEDSSSLLAQLMDKKKQLFGQRRSYSDETTSIRKRIEDLLNKLPQDSKGSLLRTFWNLDRSLNQDDMNAHFIEFSREFKAAVDTSHLLLGQNKDSISASFAGIHGSITKSLDTDTDKIRMHVQNTQAELDRVDQNLGVLETWARDNIKPIYAQDYKLFEFDSLLEIAKKFALARAKERSGGLMQLVQDPLTLKYGVFHHSLFIPFIEHFGKS